LSLPSVVRAIWGSLLLAVLAEACLALAWYRLSRSGAAPGLAMALWIWPLVWGGCAAAGLWLRPHTQAPMNPLRPGPTALAMARSLASRTLLIAVPAVVVLYAAAAIVFAWRAA